MAKKLAVISKTRPKIISQGIADLEVLAARASKNTTYNEDEIYGMFRLMVKECNTALQNGETVKINGLVNLKPSMKVGGTVRLTLQAARDALAALSNPLLWTGKKVANYANIRKTTNELIADWDINNPTDLVVDA